MNSVRRVRSPLLPDSDSGTCPGPSKQTPLGMSSGSSRKSSPHTRPGQGQQSVLLNVKGLNKKKG